MKKTILFITLFCCLFTLAAQNNVDTTEQAVLAYCADTLAMPVGQDYSQTIYEQSAAIRYTSKQLMAYKDNYIVKMSVGLFKDSLWTPEKVESFQFWIRKTLTGDNLWELNYDTAKIEFGTWHEIVLDSFIAITGASDLFFGYTIKCGGMPIAGDGNYTGANENATYFYDCLDTKKWIQYSNSGNFSIKVTVAGEHMPKYNLAINKLRTANFARTDSKFIAVANISNTVDKDVTSFDLVLYANDKEQCRQTKTLDKALKNGESLNIFFDELQLTEEGSFDVTYTIENIEGKNKDDNDKDSKVIVKTQVSNEFENKVVMFEMFSGTKCSACPNGHKYAHTAIDKLGANNFVWATHHTSYNASELTVNEGIDANEFYASPTGYAPAAMLDRTNLIDFGVKTNGGTGPVFSLNEVASEGNLEPLMELLQKNMSPIKLNVNFTLDATTRELKGSVDGTLLGDFEARDLRVGVITIEDNILGSQAGVSGKYNHTHIIRSFMTSAFGDKVTVSDGTIYKEFSQTLKDKFVLDNMRLAVWVGKHTNNSNINGFEIYQAYEVKLTNAPYVPVEYVSDNTQLVVYKEGDKLFVKGIEAGDVLSVYSMEGKLMIQRTADAETAQFDLTNLTKGAYLLQTNGSYVKFIK